MELKKQFYVGVVEDNKDPNRKGRIKVRVQTLYNNIPVEDIPYAYPFASLSGKEFQVPAVGKLVNILFLSNDLYSPYYVFSENYNENLQKKLKSLSDDEYVDFTALLFDESTQIFVKGKELTMDQLLNKITINNTTINLELKDNQQKIHLGSKDSKQSAVLGDTFFKWFDTFIKEIMLPTSFIGNLGAPVVKAKLDMVCAQYQTQRPGFLSNNVKIVDNGRVKRLSRTPGVVNNKNDVDLVLPKDEKVKNMSIYDGRDVYQTSIFDVIKEQNEKACKQLKNSAPDESIPLNKADTRPRVKDLIWSGRQTKSRINELHPDVQDYVVGFVNDCRAIGIKIEVTSGYRSFAYQKELKDRGLPAATPGYSYHNYGLAIDVKLINSNDWDTVGLLGESRGFRWGQHFKSPRPERWHFDMGFGFSTRKLLQKKNNGDTDGPWVKVNSNSTETKKRNEQEYLESSTPSSTINDPCKGVEYFNRKFEEGVLINENGDVGVKTPGSDENEEAPTRKDEEIADQAPEYTLAESTSKKLLDKISEGEGITFDDVIAEGVDTKYDITNSGGKYTPEKLPSGKSVQPLSQLSLGEVKSVQDIIRNNKIAAGILAAVAHTAIGKYQLTKEKINKLIAKNKNLSDESIFSEELQDKLSMLNLANLGYNNWINGEMSDDAFQKELSKEWPSVADPDTGQSQSGKEGTTDDGIKGVMASVKKLVNNKIDGTIFESNNRQYQHHKYYL